MVILFTVCQTILVMLVWRIWFWINHWSPNFVITCLFIFFVTFLVLTGVISLCRPDGKGVQSLLGVFCLPNSDVRVRFYWIQIRNFSLLFLHNYFDKTWLSSDCKYMKIIYVNCGWRNEYGSTPRSYEKKFRLVQLVEHSLHNCKGCFYICFFHRSSHIWFSCISSRLFTTLRVYLEPT